MKAQLREFWTNSIDTSINKEVQFNRKARALWPPSIREQTLRKNRPVLKMSYNTNYGAYGGRIFLL